jgi:hypothetical protein
MPTRSLHNLRRPDERELVAELNRDARRILRQRNQDVAFWLVIGLVFLLAGCGGSSGSSASSNPSSSSIASVSPPLPTCAAGTTPAPLQCTCPVNHLQGNGSCVIDGPGSTSGSQPSAPAPVGAWIGEVTSSGLWTSSGGVCLAWVKSDGSEAPFICADTLDYNAMVVGSYMSLTQSGAWTSLSGSVIGAVWAWPVDSNGNLIGTRETLGYYPLAVGINQASGDLYPGQWALSFCTVGTCVGGFVSPSLTFDMVPTSMNGFTPQASLVGNWSGVFCNRIPCSLVVDATGAVNGQDANGCTYAGTLTGDLTSVPTASITDCRGVTYQGAAVVVPRQVGPNTYVDWSQTFIVILAASNPNAGGPSTTCDVVCLAAGELVISNMGVPKVPTP